MTEQSFIGSASRKGDIETSPKRHNGLSLRFEIKTSISLVVLILAPLEVGVHTTRGERRRWVGPYREIRQSMAY